MPGGKNGSIFPVFFAVNGNLGPETVSQKTASSARQSEPYAKRGEADILKSQLKFFSNLKILSILGNRANPQNAPRERLHPGPHDPSGWQCPRAAGSALCVRHSVEKQSFQHFVDSTRSLPSVFNAQHRNTLQNWTRKECLGPAVAIAYDGLKTVADHRWPATNRRRAYVNKKNEVAH
jgi:hypothetical protein